MLALGCCCRTSPGRLGWGLLSFSETCLLLGGNPSSDDLQQTFLYPLLPVIVEVYERSGGNDYIGHTRSRHIVATALSGIVAGTSLDTRLVQLSAWHRVGVEPWAVYTREELRNSLLWYPPLGIGTTLVNIAAAVAVHRDRKVSRSEALPSRAVALLSIGHLLASAKATPNMLRVRQTDDPDTLQEALEGFTRWHQVRTGLDTLTFAAHLWSLASIFKP